MLKNVWALTIHFCRIAVFSCYTGIMPQTAVAADDLSKFFTTMAVSKKMTEVSAQSIRREFADRPEDQKPLEQMYDTLQAKTNGMLDGMAQYARVTCLKTDKATVEGIDWQRVNDVTTSSIAFRKAVQDALQRHTGGTSHKSGLFDMFSWIAKTTAGAFLTQLFTKWFSTDDCEIKVQQLVIQLDELRITAWASLPLDLTKDWQDQLNPLALAGTLVESLWNVVSDYHYLNVIGPIEDVTIPSLTFEPVFVQQQ